MKPAPFRHFAPSSIDEALALLHEHAPDARALAGGQSLVPMMNFRLAQPPVLVDLNRIPALASEQLIDRQSSPLAKQIPKRDVDATDGVVEHRSVAPIGTDER